MQIKILLLLSLFFISFTIFAKPKKETAIVTPPPTGNYALPASQQPAPIISFGQTLIGRNVVQVSGNTYSPYHGIAPPFQNYGFSLTYGITDNTSFYFNNVVDASNDINRPHFRSVKNYTFQLEQSYFSTSNKYYAQQGTIVGSLIVPEKSSNDFGENETFGAPALFLGTTFNRQYNKWMFFVSPGITFTTKQHHIQRGRQYLYQAGIEYDIFAVTNESILSTMVEFDGQYTNKDNFFGFLDPNSGGNYAAITPSLTLSTPRVMAGIGMGFPVVQHYFGKQQHLEYYLASLITVTIS